MNNSIKDSTIKAIASSAIASLYEGALAFDSLLDSTNNGMSEAQRGSVNLASLSITSAIDNNVAILKSLMGSNHYNFPFSVELLDHMTRKSSDAWMAVSQWRNDGPRPNYRISSDLCRCASDLLAMFEGDEPGSDWGELLALHGLESDKFQHWDHLASSIEGAK